MAVSEVSHCCNCLRIRQSPPQSKLRSFFVGESATLVESRIVEDSAATESHSDCGVAR